MANVMQILPQKAPTPRPSYNEMNARTGNVLCFGSFFAVIKLDRNEMDRSRVKVNK